MIIDNNFLNKEEQEFIKNTFTSNTFPWFLQQEAISKDAKNKKSKDFPFFCHIAFKNNSVPTEYFQLMYNIFDCFAEKHNIVFNSILRAQINLNMKKKDTIILPPHIDYNFDHNVFLYYVNDSDGDTILFNEKEKDLEKMTIKNKISPKMGKAIMFDGKTFHSGSTPKNNEYRIVINIAFI